VKRSRITSRIALLGAACTAAATVLLVVAPSASAKPTGQSTVHGNTPAWVASAQKLGPADASEQLDLTVWLSLRNEGKLQKQLHAQYTKGSRSYHQWLSQAQFDADYSPTDQQVKAVSNYLRAHGLTVGSVADNNFYVEASGSVATVQKAFHTAINTYRYHGKTYQSNASDPTVSTSGGGNIAFISGLNSAAGYQPDIARAGGSGPKASVVYQELCGGFNKTETLNVGDTPVTYRGFIPCGYDGDQLQTAYGVDQVVKGGIDGSGQTVAIVDAYGSPTILQDVNAYSKASDLPLMDSSQLQVISPVGTVHKHESKAQDPLGWQGEVTLDVEAVHAMAPGAKIVLVAAPNNYASLDEAINWVVVHHVANIVTNSWGLDTDLAAPGQASRDERIFMQAAAQGIGLDFSSGDYGDEQANTGVKSVDYPASSPWVTAVGGTSLFLNDDSSYAFETGWGTGLSKLASCAEPTPDPSSAPQECTTYTSVNPPTDLGFQGGAGGGLSYNFTAQPWQSAVIGAADAAGFGTVDTHRAVPDVSMLADPYTGMNVHITDLSAGDTSPEVEVYGGTSLASPLFAGISALVDEARAGNHMAPMGLASQYLYDLPGDAVHDVTAPPTGVGNPVDGDSTSMSLYYGSPYSGSLFSVRFNQDSSLATGEGWDDVTGVGTPIAPAFVIALS
jgi:subtilase family serine protease